MRTLIALFVAASFSIGTVAEQPSERPDESPSTLGTLLGFTPRSTVTERDWEERFRAIPEAKRVHANMVQLASHPHNVGSEAQRNNAEWLVARYKEWGWDAHIEQFDVLYPTPKIHVAGNGWAEPRSRLSSRSLPSLQDPYTHEKKTQLPGFNIYSADGDVTGPLVYVNYGMPEDYAGAGAKWNFGLPAPSSSRATAAAGAD